MSILRDRTLWRRLATLVLAVLSFVAAASCDRKYQIVDPPNEPSLDAQVRQAIGQWGVLPIGPITGQNPQLVELGQALFFDKILSGNRDVSCASCHASDRALGDGLSLAVGTGGVGTGLARAPGAGRHFISRNAPSLINGSLLPFYMFWDGRLNEGGQGFWGGPAGASLPPGINSLLAAQAMLPVLSREEMRGVSGDVDVQGNANELASVADKDTALVWLGVMRRVLAVQGYVSKFNAAYPGVPLSSLNFTHAANAIAEFQRQAFTKANTPFDRFLARDNNAMTSDQKRGALLFFGRALCSSCHFGPMLGGQTFASAGVPQIGPGFGSMLPLDAGRGEIKGQEFAKFMFRVPQLRNVELTAPYMHDGAYATLEAVVRHYNDAQKAIREYDPSQLSPEVRALYHGDDATKTALLNALDPRLRVPMNLTDTEVAQLVAFLKALTDPAARNLASVVPASVPSGLPVR